MENLNAAASAHVESTAPHASTKEDRLTSYLYHVLGLANGTTQQEADAALREEARQFDVDVDAELEARKTSLSLAALRRGSQDSTASQTSESTGFNSAASTDYPPSQRRSLSTRDYDAFLSRGTSDRQSISFSPPTTPSGSVFSLPFATPSQSPPKRHVRLIRGLSRIGISRANSASSSNNVCPHCPPDSISQRRAKHRLPCGHRLCNKALKSTIQVATDGALGAVPSCCGLPIPGHLIELVASEDEQSSLMSKFEQWNASAFSSRRPSVMSERHDSHAPQLPLPTLTDGKFVSLPNPSEDPTLTPFPTHPLYKSLYATQLSQRTAFQTYQSTTLATLQTHHTTLLSNLTTHHAEAMHSLLATHTTTLLAAEDKQVLAESLLREAHSREKTSASIALKHMEAYCNGIYARDGTPHFREINAKEREELAKMRTVVQSMDQRHEGKINVLRGEQGRWMKERQGKMEGEVRGLEREQEVERKGWEDEFKREVAEVEKEMAERREGLGQRWWIQMGVLKGRLEQELGEKVESRLPCAGFEEEGEKGIFARWEL